MPRSLFRTWTLTRSCCGKNRILESKKWQGYPWNCSFPKDIRKHNMYIDTFVCEQAAASNSGSKDRFICQREATYCMRGKILSCKPHASEG